MATAEVSQSDHSNALSKIPMVLTQFIESTVLCSEYRVDKFEKGGFNFCPLTVTHSRRSCSQLSAIKSVDEVFSFDCVRNGVGVQW